MKIIDISVPINKDTTLWPNATKISFKKTLSIERGDAANDTTLEMGIHTGTHIDAPRHFIRNGKTVEQIPLERFFGKVYVIDLGNVPEINSDVLNRINIPESIDKIIFKTSNSKNWLKNKSFNRQYIGVTASGAKWLVKKRIKLIGVDYLSIAKFDEAVEVHKILLKNNVVLLEGINLNMVKKGEYTLSCFPIKITGTEAASVRAVLIK